MPVGLREEGVSGATGYSSQQELEEWTLNYHQLEHIYIFGQFCGIFGQTFVRNWAKILAYSGRTYRSFGRPTAATRQILTN